MASSVVTTSASKPATTDDSQREQLLERRGFYFHPYSQLFILGFICFLAPGIVSVLGNLPQSLQVTPQTISNASVAHTVTSAIVGFFAGVIINAFGPRISLLVGGLGHLLYIVAFWTVRNNPGVYRFIVAAEAIQGICAALFWTAQGAMMLAYPTENRKGLVIGIFWSIFYLGPLIGAATNLSAGLNNVGQIVNNGVYAGFFILTFVGALSALLIANPAWVVRADGSKVVGPRQSSWKAALYSLYIAAKSDPMVFFLFPMFFVSGYFGQWQQLNYNVLLFNGRTRNLNSLLFAIAQMLGSVSFGYAILDQSRFSRQTRGQAGITVVLVMVLVVHIWAYFFQKSPLPPYNPSTFEMDFTNSAYPAHAWLYIFCGFMDSMWNTLILWGLGALSNDLWKLAVFVGFYRGMQVAGAEGAAQAEAHYFPLSLRLLISSWVLCLVGLLFALPTIRYRLGEDKKEDDQELSEFASSTS